MMGVVAAFLFPRGEDVPLASHRLAHAPTPGVLHKAGSGVGTRAADARPSASPILPRDFDVPFDIALTLTRGIPVERVRRAVLPARWPQGGTLLQWDRPIGIARPFGIQRLRLLQSGFQEHAISVRLSVSVIVVALMWVGLPLPATAQTTIECI